MGRLDRELPELALKAKYKAQAHSWKELPGQRGRGRATAQGVCSLCFWGPGWGGGRHGKEEDPFLHL